MLKLRCRSSIIPFLIAACALTGQPKPDAREAVSYAKSLDVATLDKTLPSQRLEDWLRHGPAHLDKVRWRISRDCDLKPDVHVSKDASPLCVKFGFSRSAVSGWGILSIGTLAKGIGGHPRLEYVAVQTKGAAPIGLENKGVVGASPHHPSNRFTKKVAEPSAPSPFVVVRLAIKGERVRSGTNIPHVVLAER